MSIDRSGPVEPIPGERATPGTAGERPRRRRGGGRAERAMVPDATFTSYYGRPVVKASPWEVDIPAYLFLGGLAAGSSLLAAGADLSDRPALRRSSRITALATISLSFAALVHDLGRPGRFVNMLRVMKPTSPMSVGTWLLTAYGPAAGLAGAAELSLLAPAPLRELAPARLLRATSRPAGLLAAVVAPTIASYTAVLLANTATPTWHDGRRELPFVFIGSASAAAGGAGLLATGGRDASPARRLAVTGAVVELLAEQVMERSMGISHEPLHEGRPGQLMRASKALTSAGAALALAGHRSRPLSTLAGAMLVAGSACTRLGVFYAGQASARDPKYTVVPQRKRLDRDGPSRG